MFLLFFTYSIILGSKDWFLGKMVYIGYTKYEPVTGKRIDCYLTWKEDTIKYSYVIEYFGDSQHRKINKETIIPWNGITEFKCNEKKERNYKFFIKKMSSDNERYAVGNIKNCYLSIPKHKRISQGEFRCDAKTVDTFEIKQETSNPYQIVYRGNDPKAEPCIFIRRYGDGSFACGKTLTPDAGFFTGIPFYANSGNVFWIKEGNNYYYNQNSQLKSNQISYHHFCYPQLL